MQEADKINVRNKMESQQTNYRGVPSREILPYGDAAIFRRVVKLIGRIRTVTWDELLELHGRSVLAAFSFSNTALFRREFGIQSTGFVFSIMTFTLITMFNSTEVWLIFKPLVMILIPIIVFFKDKGDIYEYLFIDVHSKGLMVLAVVFLVAALVHVVKIYTGEGNPDWGKRGESWIYTALSRRFDFINEYFVVGILEPLIVVLVGIVAFRFFDDGYLAIYLWLSAIATFAQESMDQSNDMDRQWKKQ